MDGPRGKNRQAGGSLIAISIIVGIIGGVMLGEPSIGFLAGLGAGILLALLVWLKNRG